MDNINTAIKDKREYSDLNLKEGKQLKGQKLLVPMINKTIRVTVSDTVFLDKENERING